MLLCVLIDTVLLSTHNINIDLGAQKNHLIETVLLSSPQHMLCLRKNKINFQGLIMHRFGLQALL